MPRYSTGSPRILVVHPWMGRGGSEAVAMWTLQALQRRAQVTFFTASPVDWQILNRAYGTSVDPDAIQLRRAESLPFIRRGDLAVTWQRSLFESQCRRIAPSFDLCISTYNPVDFGKPGIQLVGDFSFNEKARLLLYPNAEDRFCHRQSFLRRLYLSLEETLWGWRRPPLAERGDCAVANSFWTATRLERLFGLAAAPVLYPPCPPSPAKGGAARNPLGFVCLGRVSPEKEIETVIAILDRIRAAGHPVTLDLAGGFGNDAYARRIRRLVEARSQWIRTPGFLCARGKADLFSQNTYGIHACRVEAFGISVAEMAGAGLIPFVPHDGASREIVGQSELIYKTGSDAVEKVIALIQTTSHHAAIRDQLRTQCAQYRPERFIGGLITLTERFLGRPLPKNQNDFPSRNVAPTHPASH